MTKPINLYAQGWQDRSDRVRWLLEELKVPYINHWLKKSVGELNTPEYRKLNPLGRVPTIVDGDIVMSESAAICMYLSTGFSAADIMLAAITPGAQDYLVTNNPPIQKFMNQMMARDAAVRAKVF